MVNEPINIKDEEFEEKVLNSDLPIVVDFWAEWCRPCRMIMPALKKIAEEKAGKLYVAEINIDENTFWAAKYGVQGIPTMLFIKKGKEVYRQVGAVPDFMIRMVVEQFLAI